MVQLIKRDDVLAYASSVREQIQALKKSHLIFGAIIMLSLFGSYSWRIEVSEEVRDIRNSVQNFYSEFTPYMVSDILEFTRFVERFQKEVDKTDETIAGMKEARKASMEFKNQLQIMQNYGHDKTGRADLALYNAGGRIAGIGEEMELFYSCGMFWKIFGCPGRRNGPEKVIQALMYAEECFGFKGKQGAVAIRLPKPAIVDAVTIEHLPREMSPTGEVTSAPRNFSISAMEKAEDEPSELGNFLFNANETSIQMFDLPTRAPFPVKYIWFKFNDNNGHPNKTCVYRLRVHGIVNSN